jgi:hypothetical protein
MSAFPVQKRKPDDYYLSDSYPNPIFLPKILQLLQVRIIWAGQKPALYERTLDICCRMRQYCDYQPHCYLILKNQPKKKVAVITSESGWRAPNVNDFVLYPNPASSYINIDYTFQPEDTKIEILDGSGRTLSQSKSRICFKQN